MLVEELSIKNNETNHHSPIFLYVDDLNMHISLFPTFFFRKNTKYNRYYFILRTVKVLKNIRKVGKFLIQHLNSLRV